MALTTYGKLTITDAKEVTFLAKDKDGYELKFVGTCSHLEFGPLNLTGVLLTYNQPTELTGKRNFTGYVGMEELFFKFADLGVTIKAEDVFFKQRWDVHGDGNWVAKKTAPGPKDPKDDVKEEGDAKEVVGGE